MNVFQQLDAIAREMGVEIRHVSGHPGTSAEEIAKDLLKILKALQNSDVEPCFLYDSPLLRAATGMTEEEIEEDPCRFKELYRLAFEKLSQDHSVK